MDAPSERVQLAVDFMSRQLPRRALNQHPRDVCGAYRVRLRSNEACRRHSEYNNECLSHVGPKPKLTRLLDFITDLTQLLAARREDMGFWL